MSTDRFTISIYAALLVIFSTVLSNANTPSKVALIIGNSTYENISSLRNPHNDALALSQTFQELGFEVSLQTDLDTTAMRKALGQFARKSRHADMAVIYFAGHGIEVDRENYLLPVDISLTHADDLPFQAVDMKHLLRAVDGAKSLRLVLVDACRDNPMGSNFSGTRSAGRGLSRIEPRGGVLVSYAAKGGTVAYDGDGANSPYATALLENLSEPGIEIGKLFRKVRDSVLVATDGRQEPFTYGSLPSTDIFLKIKQINPIYADFERASVNSDADGWSAFIDKYKGDAESSSLVIAARNFRDALLEREIAFSKQSTLLEETNSRLKAKKSEVDEISGVKQRISEISKDFEIASANASIKSWDKFISDYENEPASAPLLNAARNMRKLLEEKDTALLAAPQTQTSLYEIDKPSYELNLPAVMTPEEAEASLNLDGRQIKHIQELLAAIGYQPGAADGQFGKKSRAALSNFQKDAGLEDHGYILPDTVDEIVKLYNSTPDNLNGVWRLNYYRTITEAEFRRRKARNTPTANDRASLHHLGFIEFEIEGRKVKTLKTIKMTSSKYAKDTAFRASLASSGLLSMSFVANYEFFSSDSRRVTVSARLPERVQTGKEFRLGATRLNSEFELVGLLTRINSQ